MARSAAQAAQVMRMAGYDVQLTRKRVKNINLRVTPEGAVCVSAPRWLPLSEIEAFVESRSSWIGRAIRRGTSKRERFDLRCDEGSQVVVWGAPLTCRIMGESPGIGRRTCSFEVRDECLSVYVRQDLADEGREASEMRSRLLADWLATQVLERARERMPLWEDVVGRRCSRIRVREMKTRWGSCNVRTGAITLNAHLAQHDPACLDYVICHELCHLHEPSHNARFHALMDGCYPRWREVRKLLEGRS